MTVAYFCKHLVPRLNQLITRLSFIGGAIGRSGRSITMIGDALALDALLNEPHAFFMQGGYMGQVNDIKGSSCTGCIYQENFLETSSLNDALNRAYSTLGVGLIFFDDERRITHINEQGRQRLSVPVGFVEEGRDILKHCFSDSDQAKLKGVLNVVLQGGSNETFVTVKIKSEVAVVMVERLETTAFNDSHSGAAMFLFDSRRNLEVSTAGVARIFSLTKAEARLAVAIVNGMTAAEYSAANGVSIHTVYTQIKGILAKTGVRRQPELVRLVLEHSPGFRSLDRHK